jgi:thiol-disulfide isomerase/thioredoxin
MKNSKSLLITMVLTLIVSVSLMAQPELKVIAVLNKADWCPVCRAHDKRAIPALIENNTDGAVKFVVYDQSNDQTTEKTAEDLKTVGLEHAIEKHDGAGMVSFFNYKTKAYISQISFAESNDKLTEALNLAKKSVKK